MRFDWGFVASLVAIVACACIAVAMDRAARLYGLQGILVIVQSVIVAVYCGFLVYLTIHYRKSWKKWPWQR